MERKLTVNSLLITMIWLPKKFMQCWGYQHIPKIRTMISPRALHRADHMYTQPAQGPAVGEAMLQGEDIQSPWSLETLSHDVDSKS